MKGFGLDDIEMRPKAPADHGPLFGPPLCVGGRSTPESASPPPASGAFAGAVYEPDRDDARLTGQMERIWRLMKHGGWHTLEEIATETGDPPASVSAQLRHMRREKFGSHAVAKRLRGTSKGLWEYRVAP